MKTTRLIAAGAMALAIASVFAQGAGPGQAQGQGQGGQRRGGQGQAQGLRQQLMGAMGGGGRLLLNAAVQKELKMTPEQIEKAKTTFANAAGLRQGGAGGGQREGAGAGLGAGQAQQVEQRRVEQEKQVKEILDATQFERYTQIALQQQGAGALARKDISEKVGLSADQVAKIRQIQQDQIKAFREAMQAARGNAGAGGGGAGLSGMREQMTKMREDVNAKILAVLTSDQKKKWDTLLGPAFKLN